MKNLSKEDQNKIYAVIIIISIILLLVCVLIFFGMQEEKKETNDITSTTRTTSTRTDDTVTTTTSTTKTTTTTTKLLTNKEIASKSIKKYLDNFYIKNYISSYEINNINLLNKVDCHKLEEDENKIYALVSITYKKINETVEINPNEIKVQGNTYKLNVIYIVDKSTGNIENIKKTC